MSHKEYLHWESHDLLEKYFKPKPWAQMFRSEKYFLEKIFKPSMSVLDIGCGTGQLYHGLEEKFKSLNYTGLDISKNFIIHAKKLAPKTKFIHGNILKAPSLLKNKKFDIVSATGVFQHEPQSKKLLTKMIEHAKLGGFILFDLKLFHTHPSLCNIKKSYCQHSRSIHFIVFNFNDLIKLLLNQEKIGANIQIYGYYSGTHQSVRLPKSVREPVCSAHLLLQKSKIKSNQLIKLELNLPKEFIANL